MAGYTSGRCPVQFICSWEFSTREEALACERQIKGWRRSKKEAMIRGDWNEVSRLAHVGSSFDKLRTNGKKQEIGKNPFTLSLSKGEDHSK